MAIGPTKSWTVSECLLPAGLDIDLSTSGKWRGHRGSRVTKLRECVKTGRMCHCRHDVKLRRDIMWEFRPFLATSPNLRQGNWAGTARNQALGPQYESQFLATMSHEIRTPLNGVMGLNGLLLEPSWMRFSGNTPRCCRTPVSVARRINDILESPAGGRQGRLRECRIRPARLVDEVAAVLAVAAHTKHLDWGLLRPGDFRHPSGDPDAFVRSCSIWPQRGKFTESGKLR